MALSNNDWLILIRVVYEAYYYGVYIKSSDLIWSRLGGSQPGEGMRKIRASFVYFVGECLADSRCWNVVLLWEVYYVEVEQEDIKTLVSYSTGDKAERLIRLVLPYTLGIGWWFKYFILLGSLFPLAFHWIVKKHLHGLTWSWMLAF